MSKTKLLVGTRNAAKFREYQELLAHLPLELTSLKGEGIELRIRETGESFRQNAILKARGYAEISGLPTLTDDSGLEVEALGGEPGVRSARYVGPRVSDEELNRFLLAKLEGIPWEKRKARFQCVAALAKPQGETHITEGHCAGIIALSPAGKYGFGYDPIFYLPEYGLTMAQLKPEAKNRISHRAMAAKKMAKLLPRILGL